MVIGTLTNHTTTPTSASTVTTTATGTEVITPTPTQSGMARSCNAFYYVQPDDGCWQIAETYSIDQADFYKWNPAIGDDCKGLQPDYYVCVGVDSDVSSATATPTSTGSAVVTPTPVQPGIVPSCDEFYFVQPGDECETLAKSHGIALGDFYTWNPAVKNDCGGLQANVYVCVGVSSSNITPSPSKSTGSAVSTPTPTQAGMTGSCGSFYYVKAGDGCWEIAHSYSIEL